MCLLPPGNGGRSRPAAKEFSRTKYEALHWPQLEHGRPFKPEDARNTRLLLEFVAGMIKAILFDMGGVLVELRSESHLLPLLRSGTTREDMWQRWSTSLAVRAHETGVIGEEEFGVQIVRELGITVSPDEFLRGFRDWIIGPFAETPKLIRDTAARYQTALLTNTSALHWPIIETLDILPHMHHVVASYQVGRIKPDRAYFEHALQQVGVSPAECVFFDDSGLNVAAAQGLGINAHRVEGAQATRNVLTGLGLL